LKPKKPNQTGKKLSQTKTKPKKTEQVGLNWFFPQNNQTETGRFEPVSLVFQKTGFGYILTKTEPNRK